MIKQSGKIAGKNGYELESLVKNVLESEGYQFIEKNKFLLATKTLTQKFYTRQLRICDSIYSAPEHQHKLNADFIVYNPNGFGNDKYIIMECNSQTSSGSVDEKYPYLNENIKTQYPHPTIIILDAPKAKEGAKKWLQKQKNINPKLLEVFGNFSDFRAWAKKNM